MNRSNKAANRWGLNEIYGTHYENWTQLEEAIARIEGTKERGDAFEQFCYFYFLYHKDLYDIEELWCDKVRGRSIPEKIRAQYKLERKDLGVDGASRLRSGELEAWQAKFRADRSAPTIRELATFWAESEYANRRRIVANSTSLPEASQKRKDHQQTLVDRFLELDIAFFKALSEFANEESGEFKREKFSPRKYQQDIVQNVVAGLCQNSRGKLIAAPGIGKTLAALWIVEHQDTAASKVLVLVPSIYLVRQTLCQWTMHQNKPFAFLCVCSDATVGNDMDETADIRTGELGVPVTTSIDEIKDWLQAAKPDRKYIFSTYHSENVLEEAVKAIEGFEFDLIIFDEAHRTVGRADQLFSAALSDARIPARKRLFMTATQRIINPRIKALAANAGVEVFSMSDESTYGPVLYEYNVGQAIQDRVIADYEIVLAGLSGDEIKSLVEVNRLLAIESGQDMAEPLEITADQLFKASFLLKAFDQNAISKTIAFHSLRNRAISFSKMMSILVSEIPSLAGKIPYISYVLGDQPAGERRARITAFEEAPIGVLSNVQVLSEGVDIPLIDSVYFVDPKTSVIEIVQATGRALRKPFGQDESKVARIIVPVVVPEDAQTLDDVDWDDTLQTFHYVIQAMRAQDHRLEEEIDQINLYETTGRQRGRRVGSSGKIRVMAPALELRQKIDLESFLDRITLRIATANANADGTKWGFSHLGRGERRSEYTPLFGLLGDYNPDVYERQLVRPTLALFSNIDSEVSRSALKINHNNIAHTKRLGLIEDRQKTVLGLTPLGRDLWSGVRSFRDVFVNQMMLYSTEHDLYPYRLLVQLLITLDKLSHIEFLYGPYTIQSTNGQPDIKGAIGRIAYIRDNFPQVELTSVRNRDEVRQELNSISPVEVSDVDLWGDRSTPKNKFRYAKNALALFDFIEASDNSYKTPMRIRGEMKETAKRVLEQSAPSRAPMSDFYGEWYWG